MRTLTLPADVVAAIERHAAQGYPFEVVGILAGDAERHRVDRTAELPNEHAAARNRYRVSGLSLMRAERALEAKGHAIIGYYHSHPDRSAIYSATDCAQALPNRSYVIVGVLHGVPGQTRSWRLREDRTAMDAEPIHREDRHDPS